MGFRNPITTAKAVDTGQPSGAGVRIYQAPTQYSTTGIVEFRDGVGDSPSQILATANLTPQGGGGYTEQGGGLGIHAGSWNGLQGPGIDLNVEGAPAGGYQAAAYLRGVSTLQFPDDAGWTDYDIAWQTAGYPPSYGNGSFYARYRRNGLSCDVGIFGSFGSTTSGGNGSWSFGLPFPSAAGREQYLTMKAYCGAGNFIGWAYMGGGATRCSPFLPTSASSSAMAPVQNANSTNAAGTGVPAVSGAYTFSNTYNFGIFGRYEVAAGH